jgi:hypothetical protein
MAPQGNRQPHSTMVPPRWYHHTTTAQHTAHTVAAVDGKALGRVHRSNGVAVVEEGGGGGGS